MELNQFRIDGQIALVTGGTRGIGLAIARLFVKAGAKCMLSSRSLSPEASELIDTSPEDYHFTPGEVTAPDTPDQLVQATLNRFGRLDILVNNAGIRITRTVADTQEDEFDRLFAINVKGPFFACQQAVHRISDGGRIINISSAVTRMMLPGYSIYAASKAAVDQLTRVLAKEIGERQVTVNAVCPGPVDTELLREGKTEEQLQGMAQMAAFNRLGKVEDIADVVAFLASDHARWITGQVVHVNGGYI